MVANPAQIARVAWLSQRGDRLVSVRLEPLYPDRCERPPISWSVFEKPIVTIELLPIALGKTAYDLTRTRDQGAALVTQVVEAQQALYLRTGATGPWIGYFARNVESGEILGSCSFVGAPANGAVEIAYFTFPYAEGSGVARQAAAALIDIAREAGATLVFAHTLPEENVSTHILKRLGFTQTGMAHDDDAGAVWRWEQRLGR
jgi:RimJ/RimL family protein N-acetyltransferase